MAYRRDRPIAHSANPGARSLTMVVRAVDLDQDPPSVSALDDLEPIEQERADRFLRRVDRHRFLQRRLELRRLLGREMDCAAGDIRFDAGPHGKPSVAWPPSASLQFSTTSTEGARADRDRAGAGRRRLAARVRAHRVSAAAAEIFCSTYHEFDAWSGLSWPSRILAFFVAWTRKEASVKATGLGLGGCPPNQLDVTFQPPANLGYFPSPERDSSRHWPSKSTPGEAARSASSVARRRRPGYGCSSSWVGADDRWWCAPPWSCPTTSITTGCPRLSTR